MPSPLKKLVCVLGNFKNYAVYMFMLGIMGEMLTEEIKNKNALPKTPGLSSEDSIPDIGDEEGEDSRMSCGASRRQTRMTRGQLHHL